LQHIKSVQENRRPDKEGAVKRLVDNSYRRPRWFPPPQAKGYDRN